MDLNKGKSVSDLVPANPAMRGVRALVLVGGRGETERFAGFPLALVDVLGRSPLMRAVDRIHASGISEIAVIGDTAPLPLASSAGSCTFNVAGPESFWGEALQQFRKLSRHSECVLVMRLGAWAEVDFAAMVAEHRQAGSAIMRAASREGEPLDVFVISSNSQTEAAALLRGELRDNRIAFSQHTTQGYVNQLAEAADIRLLTLDAFVGNSEVRPCGREIRPGVWVGKGARIHRNARIVAPAFIGDGCKVRDAVVITRGSSLERNSEVDCATMIDNSSVLPYTRIGAGLEFERSIAGYQQVHSLPRNATVKVEDPHMLALTNGSASSQVLSTANWFVNFLPNVFWKLFFERKAEQMDGVKSNLLDKHTPTLDESPLVTAESQPKSYREMVVTRRYGNE